MEFTPNPHYLRQIRRLRKAVANIPFSCDPGCTDCCNRHAWSWTEWLLVPAEIRRVAIAPDIRCPYATANGCSIYEYRSIICRLYALGGNIGDMGPAKNISLACPRGHVSPDPLPRKQARDIFVRYMSIIHREARDMQNAGIEPTFAGPYGKYAGMPV